MTYSSYLKKKHNFFYSKEEEKKKEDEITACQQIISMQLKKIFPQMTLSPILCK
jgi:hypothetical protein